MGEVIVEALIDTLKLLPVLLAVHILIEIFENKAGVKLSRSKALKGGAAPLIGAAVGVIPQCGFSVVAAKLYTDKSITLGTLLAVFISTSDEALPLLFTSAQNLNKLWPLILIKLIFALVVGYSFDLAIRLRKGKGKGAVAALIAKNDGIKCETTAEINKGQDVVTEEEVCTSEKNHEKSAQGVHRAVKGCHHHEIGESGEKGIFNKYLLHPILHTLVITAYILVVNLALGIIIYFVTEEKLVAFMQKTTFFQPFLTALIGLIPNCASSVLITQMYAVGGLTLGSTVAGLSVNAGLGFAVLFKENKNAKQNFFILGFTYIASAVLGLVINIILLS